MVKPFTFSHSYSSSTRQPSYFHNVGAEPLKYRTLGQQLALTADKYGDREAIVSCHENVRLTYSEVLTRADKLAAAFESLGLERGSRVGIWAPNIANWFVTMMAAARAGLVLVGLNPAYQIPEMQYCLNKVQVKAIVVPESFKSQNYVRMLTEMMPEMESCKGGEIRNEKLPHLNTVIVDAAPDKQFR